MPFIHCITLCLLYSQAPYLGQRGEPTRPLPQHTLSTGQQDILPGSTCNKMARLRVDATRPSPSRSQDSLGSNSRLSSIKATTLPACDLFNTTFSLYRASPLFVGADDLSDTRLQTLELRLRDILAGDFVRGIEVGLDEDGDRALGNAGALEAVAIEWVSAHQAVATSKPALQVTLQYENSQCLAVLLPVPGSSETANGTNAEPRDAFLSLPLLLLRMPVPLKDIIVSFLSNSFDCRISALHLTDKDVVHGWESWAYATTLPTSGSFARDAVLTLAFSPPDMSEVADTAEDDDMIDSSSPVSSSPTRAVDATLSLSDTAGLGLKTVDIFVPNDDLRGFLEAGQHLESTHGASSMPFTNALAFYVKTHLGLDMAHPAVSVVRVACGGFVLSSSRLKIFEPPGSRADIYLNRHGGIIPLILGNLALRASG